LSDRVDRAPAHVHHYVGLLRLWCLDNPWQAVYTRRDISASVLRDERQISSIAPKALASSYKELKNDEALAKDTTNVLSYCELALYGISECLQQSNTELPEETTQLCSSLHVGLRHAIALSCKASANAVLKRRDSVITEVKSVIRLPPADRSIKVCTFRGILPIPRLLGGSDQDSKVS
jgi:hypothetical protein